MEQKKDEKKEIENNKENTKKEEIKKEKEMKRPSAWVFLYGENLRGFHIAFALMIIIPITVFFIIRNILAKFNFSKNQQDVFGVIGVLISVWAILISLAIYYFKDDFHTVFCKKKEDSKTKEKSE